MNEYGFEGLSKQFAELKTRFMDLRERVESIPPADPPGFNDARARFYAAEEARGTTEAKVAWLTGRLDARRAREIATSCKILE